MARNKDTHHMHFEMTQSEYAQLCSKAKRCGLTKRKLLIRLIKGEPIRERPSPDMQKLLAEINMVGSNINQIARSVNAGIATPEDAHQALFLLGQVYAKLDEVMKS